MLAMKNPMIGEKISSRLTDIEFDINKSLERLRENEISKGTASQQYVMTNTNELANLLGEILQNLNESLNPSGGGGGGGDMQIPDIIMSQEELNQKMKEGIEKSEGEGEEGEGEEGKEKKGDTGEGEEEMSGRIFEIFKEQQKLRHQLEERLREKGLDLNRTDLLRKMEQAERDILEKGYDRNSHKRMQDISHKLLELEMAILEQEDDERRQANSNEKSYKNSLQEDILKAREYFRSEEILNRQALPLQQIYKTKVNKYFEGTED
jgi:hypothetical protein